ncbi:hypothetical protein ABPG75_009421 [Micractinium tetrahymenae]
MAAVPLLRALPPPRPCLASPAGDFLSRQGVAVSLVNQRLRHSALGSGCVAPPPVELAQAQAVHTFLLQQQRLRRITSAALVLESTPEALLLDVQQQLRPLLAALKDMGLSQEQTTAVFRGLRRQRDQAARFLALGPAELQRRHFWLCRRLGLEGGGAAAYLAAQPSLLLADPAEAAAVVHWLQSAAGWRRQALRRNLAAHPAILLSSAAQLEAAATLIQCRLDASLDELALLLQLAPRLLALPPPALAAAAEQHGTAWRLAAAFAERPALMMRDAAEALHMNVATLFLMHLHGMSRQQVAALARSSPTLLRTIKLH